MTSASALPPLHGRVLVWDTSPLFHAIKARKIEILGITRLPIWGSLRVVAEAVKDGSATEYAATTLVDTMMATGMRYPFQAGQFIGWAKQNGML
jgi:hypothetical protein